MVLTGAGVSAESGLWTFRDSNGLWNNHRIEQIPTREAFERNPKMVWEFYSARRRNALSVSPNAAHHALAVFSRTCKNKSIEFTLVTQKWMDAGNSSPLCRCCHAADDAWQGVRVQMYAL